MNTLLLLSLTGVCCLLCEVLSLRKVVPALVVLGLAAAFVANLCDWNVPADFYNDMMRVDNYAVAFAGVLTGTSLLWTLLSPGFFREESSRIDHYALVVFALTGALVMVTYNNLLMLFLGIEILSIPMYILAGSRKQSLESNEASVKYFLLGAFATGFLLFGIAFLYGVTGSFHLDAIAAYVQTEGSGMMLYAGLLLILVALAFKSSIVPFHFWAPDVYQGSPTPVTALMSTMVKTAAFAAFYKLFAACFASVGELWMGTLWVLSAITILAGNITAVYQKNIKRLLAYSSVAHAGYLLLPLLAMNEYAQGSLLFYTVAYSLSSLAAFTVLAVICREGEETIDAFRGLAWRSPWLAGVMLVSLLSLAGIPPLAGFFAKYYVFSAALRNGHTALVLIAVAGSLIGVYYYFRVLIAMFRSDETTAQAPVVSLTVRVVLILTTLATVVLGVLPGLLSVL